MAGPRREEAPNGPLERLGSLPGDKYGGTDLRERLAGLESVSNVPVPKPVSVGKFRSRRPSGLVLDGFALEQS